MDNEKETLDMPLAALIDHTLLAPEGTAEEVETLCRDAASWGTATVCVYPYRVSRAAKLLAGSGVGVCTVVGFPFGLVSSFAKVSEAAAAAEAGANEFDMVINLGALADGDLTAVASDIRAVRDALPAPYILKVILETAALTPKQVVDACLASEQAGADFVKTSSGFHPKGGATVEMVSLMAKTVPSLGVKASGGINSLTQAQAFLAAGATRLGSKSTATILGF